MFNLRLDRNAGNYIYQPVKIYYIDLLYIYYSNIAIIKAKQG